MHVHNLLKERLPIESRTLKEPALHSIFFFSLLQMMPNKYFKNAIRLFACVTKQRTGSDKLIDCLTASCKAFSLANGKGKGTNGLVIVSLD